MSEQLLREIWNDLQALEDMYNHDELTDFETEWFEKLRDYFKGEK